ncbi:MAG: SMC-Scp complex subunit ScpB [Promethearchaeota archaeon]
MEEEYDHNSEEEKIDEESEEEKIDEESVEGTDEGLEEGAVAADDSENLEEEKEQNSSELEVDEMNEVDEEILADLEELDKQIGPTQPFNGETPEEFTEVEDEGEIGNDALGLEERLKEEPEGEIEGNLGGEGVESAENVIVDGEGELESELDGDSGIGESSEGEGIEEFAEISEDEKQSEEVDAHTQLKNIVEGALFVAGRPVSIEELNAKTDIGKRDLISLLEELSMDYLIRSTALELVNIQDKFSLQIKPEYTPRVKKFATGGLIPDRILKTLTIIALKQPLMKSMLVKLRGSTAYEHVKFLIDRGYIEAWKKGRSHELMTTDQFADTFGLSRDIETLKKQMIIQLGLPEA